MSRPLTTSVDYKTRHAPKNYTAHQNHIRWLEAWGQTQEADEDNDEDHRQALMVRGARYSSHIITH